MNRIRVRILQRNRIGCISIYIVLYLKGIYFKKLARAIVETGKSKTYKGDQPAGNSDRIS